MKKHNLFPILLVSIVRTILPFLLISIMAGQKVYAGVPTAEGFNANVTKISINPSTTIPGQYPTISGYVQNLSSISSGYDGAATFDIKVTIQYPNGQSYTGWWNDSSFSANQTKYFTKSNNYDISQSGTYSVIYYVYNVDRSHLFSMLSKNFEVESNICPTLSVTYPSSNLTVTQGQSVSISWNGTDPDDAATVSVGYDEDNVFNNGNHTWLGSLLNEDGNYTWDTSGVTPGTYYIFGMIYDGDCSNHDFASGKVTVRGQGYSISGQVLSNRWPYDGIPGVTIHTDSGQSCFTDSFGSYSLENVPSDNYTITASKTDYFATGTSNSVSRSVDVTSNLFGIDFTDFSCKGLAQVSISVDQNTVVPGQTFNVTVTLKNTNYVLSDVLSYLDLSFNDSKVTVGNPLGTGWTTLSPFPVGSTIWVVDSSGNWSEDLSADYLISASRTGSFDNNANYSFTVPLTVKSTATSGTIVLKYRGTIGDHRNPVSTGSGTLDQQGLNVFSHEVFVDDGSSTVPPEWGAGEEISPAGGYQLSGSFYKIRKYLNGQHYLVFKTENESDYLEKDPNIIKLILTHHSMLSGDGSWDFYLTSCQNKTMEWQTLAGDWRNHNITIDPQDYTDLCEKQLYSKVIIWGAVMVAGIGAALTAIPSGGASIAVGAVVIGSLFAAGGSIMVGISAVEFVNNVKEEDEYTLVEREYFFNAMEFLELGSFDEQQLVNDYSLIGADDIANGLSITTLVGEAAVGSYKSMHELSLAPAKLSAANIGASLVAEASSRFIDWRFSQTKNDYFFILALNDHHAILERLAKEIMECYEIICSPGSYEMSEINRAYSTLPMLLAYYHLNYMELASNKRFEKLRGESIKEEFLASNYDLIDFNAEKNLAVANGEAWIQKTVGYYTFLNNLITTTASSYEYLMDTNQITGTAVSWDLKNSLLPTIYAGGQGNFELKIENMGETQVAVQAVNLSATNNIDASILTVPDYINPGESEGLIFSLDSSSANQEFLLTDNYVTVKLDYTLNGEAYQRISRINLDTRPPISFLPYNLGSSLCNRNQTKSFQVVTEAAFSGNVVFKVCDFSGNTYTVASFSASIGRNEAELTWDVPNDAKNGPYAAIFEVTSNNFTYEWKYPRLFTVLPVLLGDISEFDMSKAVILTHVEDDEISKRLKDALNVPIYQFDDIGNEDLFSYLWNSDLILVGGHFANPIVNDLRLDGKIQTSWTEPGDASVEIVDGYNNHKAIVIAGYTIEDTFLAGLKFLNIWSGLPLIDPIFDESIKEGTSYTGPTPVLCPGAESATWSLEGPSGMTINSSTGVVSWSSPTVTGSPHTITIRATNSAGSDQESWQLTVTENVIAPVINPISDGSTVEGTSYTGPKPTLSQGTQPITWSLVTGPSGMTINSSTGVVSWSSPTVTAAHTP